MLTPTLLRQVIPRRRIVTRSYWTLSAIVAVGTGVVLTQTGVAARRNSTAVAGAAVRRVILPILRLGAHTSTAATLLPEVVPCRRNSTILHRTFVCVPVRTYVPLARPRVGARFCRTRVARVAVRRVILPA